MPLKAYQKKRKFIGKKKTTEPRGRVKSSKGKNKIFVIHSHFARSHHYDLRLEMNKVLKSWAVPKEPPRAKGIKRLAIQVEDYGAGRVEIWDHGTYELKNKDDKKIEFKLNGKKMKGNYVLVKTKYGAKPEKSWLFMKV